MSHLEVRVVDADQPRSADRRLVQVAEGVLVRADDAFLLTSRPEGKAYAGYWEFPAASSKRAKRWRKRYAASCKKKLGSPSKTAPSGRPNALTIRMPWYN